MSVKSVYSKVREAKPKLFEEREKYAVMKPLESDHLKGRGREGKLSIKRKVREAVKQLKEKYAVSPIKD